MRDPHYQVIMVGCVLSQLKPSELYLGGGGTSILGDVPLDRVPF